MGLRIRRLRPKHLQQLIRVDQVVFPESFQMEPSELFYYLSGSELNSKNYSLGLFDGDRLVGYNMIIRLPSEFHDQEEILFLMRLAVLSKFRRVGVQPLLIHTIIQSILSGVGVEGKIRERTAFRTVQRISHLIRQSGFRAVLMVETDRVGGDRMVHTRFENIWLHLPIIHQLHWVVYTIDTLCRKIYVFPRRLMRKLGRTFPKVPWPKFLRVFGYLEPAD